MGFKHQLTNESYESETCLILWISILTIKDIETCMKFNALAGLNKNKGKGGGGTVSKLWYPLKISSPSQPPEKKKGVEAVGGEAGNSAGIRRVSALDIQTHLNYPWKSHQRLYEECSAKCCLVLGLTWMLLVAIGQQTILSCVTGIFHKIACTPYFQDSSDRSSGIRLSMACLKCYT